MTKTLPLFLMIASTGFSQKAPVTMSEFVQSWKNTKAYTLAVAEAMPAESYDFKPTPEEMSFSGQMIHIGHANYAWFAGVLGEKRTIADPKKDDKTTVVAYLRDTFDYCIAALDRITLSQLNQSLPGVGGRDSGSGRDALLNMYMHVAHHRGQAVVYLRLKGITPPDYHY
jgi:uncharacterized damage-inducible protein DinB